jgi:cell division protein FtsQ
MDREIGATVYAGGDDRAVKLGFGRYREKCKALGNLMLRLRRDSRLKRYRVIDLVRCQSNCSHTGIGRSVIIGS